MSLLIHYSVAIAAALILAIYGKKYWEKAKYKRMANEYIMRKKLEKEASGKEEHTPYRTNTPERISKFSASRRSTKSMMHLPGLGQESPFKNSPAISSRKLEHSASKHFSETTRDQSRLDGIDQTSQHVYTPSRVVYPAAITPNFNNGSQYHNQPLASNSNYSTPQEYHAFTPDFTPTKRQQVQNLPTNSILYNTSNEVQFKMPRAVAKDTPRPNQNGSIQMPQLRHAYAPSAPSPLNFSAGTKTTRNELENDTAGQDLNFSSKDINESRGADMNVRNSDQQTTLNTKENKEKDFAEIKIDVAQKSEIKPSKKRPADTSTQTPSTRRKKSSRSKKVHFGNDKDAPQSVRKSAVSVAIRKSVYEGVTNSIPLSDESTKDLQASKRKLVQNENEINPVFLPDHGFNWIGGEPKGKRIKLDKDTIVRKRIEYFRNLGVEVPTSNFMYKSSTDSPTLQKLRDVSRIQKGDVVSNGGRIAFSTPKKSVASNELWKIDDDELDEMTMKRLEGDGKKKTVSFGADTFVKETGINGEKKVADEAEMKKIETEKAPISLGFGTPAANTDKNAELGKLPSQTGPVPAFNFTKPAGDAVQKDVTSRLGDKPSDAKPMPLFNFGNNSQLNSGKDTTSNSPTEFKKTESANAPSPAVAPSFGSSLTTSDTNASTNLSASINAPSKAPNFSFGTTVAASKPPAVEPAKPMFNFGSDSAKPIEPPKSSATSGLGDTTKPNEPTTFKFGANPPKTEELSKPPVFGGVGDSSKPSESIKPGGFSFGAPAANINEASKPPGFVGFGDTSKPSELTKPSGFSFGTPSSNTNEPAKPPTFGGFGDTSKNVETSKPNNFTFGSTGSDIVKPNSALGIGSLKPEDTTKSTGFTFGAPTSNTGETGKPPAFGGFGTDTSKASEPPKPAAFGDKIPSGTDSSTPNFSFGASTNVTSPASFSFQSGATATNPPAFGASSTAANNTAVFGSSVPAFGTTSAAPPAFGQNSTHTGIAATAPTPAFGASGTPTAQPFGSSTTPAAAAPAFGTAPSTPTPFQFGTSQPSTPAAPGTGFSFGSSATSNPPPFGQPSSSATNSFGQTSANAFGATNQPQANAFGAPAPSANTFGQSTPQATGFSGFGSNPQTPTPAPVFGQPQQQNQPKPGFNFGSGGAPQAPAFGFNAPAPAASQFQFGQAAAPSTPGTPGFQFGGAVPQFAAQPQAPVAGRPLAQPKFRRGPKGRR